MKTHFQPLSFRAYAILFLLVFLYCGVSAHAAIRQGWVQHFDGGFPNKTSQPVAMQLDSSGNIYVVGSAANASNLLDYVTLKYTSSGTLLWSRRYGTTNGLINVPRAVGMDTNDNLYITGTSKTVKYSTGGDELWTAPFNGRSLAVQGTNLYVTGFSEAHFATVSLSQEGETKWLKSYQGALGGPDFSMDIFADGIKGISVIGRVTSHKDRQGDYQRATLVKYDALGNDLLTVDMGYGVGSLPTQATPGYPSSGLRLTIQGDSGRLYLLGKDINFSGLSDGLFGILGRDADGTWLWDFQGWTAGGAFVATAAESQMFTS